MAGEGDVPGQPGSKPASVVDEDMVRALARLLDETRLTEIEIEREGLRVRVARQPSPAYPSSAPEAERPVPGAVGAADPAQHPGVVVSPMVGTAYRAPEPGAKPFCEIGSLVKAGDTLLARGAIKPFRQIPAPGAGACRQILSGDAAPGDSGEPLMISE